MTNKPYVGEDREIRILKIYMFPFKNDLTKKKRRP